MEIIILEVVKLKFYPLMVQIQRWINAGVYLFDWHITSKIDNDDSNTNASRFLTFVDSSSGNNNVKARCIIKI
ncbi:MAG: hypothetical protein CM15mL3_0050 [Kanaloavirus sp.]|nr:MAG: hypothetical protein CM15mL3_0050 [Kanaloavirus sp.]